MTVDEFTYWIKGYLELTNDGFLDKRQLNIIENHANLVEAVIGFQDKNIERFIRLAEEKVATNNQINISMLNMND